jgi:hypothetical protein
MGNFMPSISQASTSRASRATTKNAGCFTNAMVRRGTVPGFQEKDPEMCSASLPGSSEQIVSFIGGSCSGSRLAAPVRAAGDCQNGDNLPSCRKLRTNTFTVFPGSPGKIYGVARKGAVCRAGRIRDVENRWTDDPGISRRPVSLIHRRLATGSVVDQMNAHPFAELPPH